MSEESNTVICNANIIASTTANDQSAMAAETTSTKTAADSAASIDIADEDLEDGEIDDDDEDGDDDVVITNAIISSIKSTGANASASSNAIENNASSASTTSHKPLSAHHNADTATKIPIIDLTRDHTPSPTSVKGGISSKSEAPAKSRKSKKGQPPADDYMEEVEKLLSNVLKKSGVKPQMPKCLESRQEAKETDITVQIRGQGRSSRWGKRKKQREEKEKEKERKEKEKVRYTSPENFDPPITLDDDEDDFEMLNVVGGSPSSTPVPKYAPPVYPPYDSAKESYTSYDSCLTS